MIQGLPLTLFLKYLANIVGFKKGHTPPAFCEKKTLIESQK